MKSEEKIITVTSPRTAQYVFRGNWHTKRKIHFSVLEILAPKKCYRGSAVPGARLCFTSSAGLIPFKNI